MIWRPASLSMVETGWPVPHPMSRIFELGERSEMAFVMQDFLMVLFSYACSYSMLNFVKVARPAREPGVAMVDMCGPRPIAM